MVTTIDPFIGVKTTRLMLQSNFGGVTTFLPAATSQNTLFQFPPTAGSVGQVLSTDGNGNLSWISVSGTGTVTSVSTTLSGLTVTTNSTTPVIGGTLGIASGGTGATTSTAALNALLPSQAGNANRFLTTNGSGVISWGSPAGTGTVTSVSTTLSGLTVATNTTTPVIGGTLGLSSGGTGATTATAALNNLLPAQTGNANKYLTTNGAGVISWGNSTAVPLTIGSTTLAGGSPSGVLLNTSNVLQELPAGSASSGSAVVKFGAQIAFKPVVWEVATIAALRALSPTEASSAEVLGYYAKGDGGGGIFYSVTTGGPYTDNGGTIITFGGLPSSSAWIRVVDGFVSACMFGAINNIASDSTVYLQNAINYALSAKLPLLLDGRFTITSSLIINRRVGTTKDVFVIYADGSGNGIYASTPITFFDTTLAFTVNPVSEFITFQGVHFEAPVAVAGAYVMSKKFLRIRFETCNFREVKCLTSDIYIQTWYFSGCHIRGWGNGFFLSVTGGCYDVTVSNCIVEDSTGGFISLYDAANVTTSNGVRIIDNLIEGMQGSGIVLGGARGCVISGNYFEVVGWTSAVTSGIYNPTINLDVGTLPTLGLIVSTNFFSNTPANSSWWAIKWGRVQLAESNNNWCNGYLHDNSTVYLSGGQWGVSSMGDWSTTGSGTTQLWKIPRGNVLSAMVAEPIYAPAAQAGGAFTIEPCLYSIFRLTTSSSIGNSCNFPVGGVVGQRINIQFINSSASPIATWTFTGSWSVSAWTPLAAGQYRSKDFYFDGSRWRELSTVDV